VYNWLFIPFIDDFGFLNVFRYITVRIGLSALTAMVITLALGPWVIRKLQALKYGQEIQKDSQALYDIHKKKQGTPTMGGILFVGASFLATLLWGNLSETYVVISLVGILLFGLVGFIDDYQKIRFRQNKGLSAWQKFLAQSILALCLGLYLLK